MGQKIKMAANCGAGAGQRVIKSVYRCLQTFDSIVKFCWPHETQKTENKLVKSVPTPRSVPLFSSTDNKQIQIYGCEEYKYFLGREPFNEKRLIL